MKTIDFLLNALLVSAAITLVSACVGNVDSAYTTTLVLHSESGSRIELAKFKQTENCLKTAAMWQTQAASNYTGMFECDQK